MNGYLPENEIDHIDRNPSNNKIKNLRHVSKQCNIRNRGKQSNNTSGIPGISYYKKSSCWIVRIGVNKKEIYLGSYKEFIDAVKSRWAAEVKYNFTNCKTTSLSYKYLVENNLIEGGL
jgi:hypothetical protein